MRASSTLGFLSRMTVPRSAATAAAAKAADRARRPSAGCRLSARRPPERAYHR